MDMKQAYEEKLEAQLREWQAKIDQLKARADRAEAEKKIDYQQEIDSLQARQQALQEKLEELRGAGEDAWEEVKAGAELAWRDLEQAVNRAFDHFK